MSAIKRDHGVENHGILIRGLGSLLERIDSVCFAAPVFCPLSRCFFGK